MDFSRKKLTAHVMHLSYLVKYLKSLQEKSSADVNVTPIWMSVLSLFASKEKSLVGFLTLARSVACNMKTTCRTIFVCLLSFQPYAFLLHLINIKECLFELFLKSRGMSLKCQYCSFCDNFSKMAWFL